MGKKSRNSRIKRESRGMTKQQALLRLTKSTTQAMADAGIIEKTTSGEVLLRAVEKTGRNTPCPCGSKKKFKKCHEQTLQQRFAAYENMTEYPDLAGGPFSNDATSVEGEG